MRRWVLVLGGAALLLAACSPGEDGARPSDPAPTAGGSVASGPSSTADSGSEAATESTPTSAASEEGTTTTSATRGGGGGTATSQQAAVPRPAGVGAFGPFYLGAGRSSEIVLDVRSQSGAGPRSRAVERVRSVLGEIAGKPVSVTTGSVPGGGREWTADDIRAVADSGGPVSSRDGAVLTLLFLRGGSADRDTALGVAVRSDVAAIFADRVTEGAGVLGDRDRVETAVVVHEVGHLLGLVDLVLDTGRADPEHPGHSTNRESVMYHAVESTLVGSLLDGGPPVSFDAADRADLATIAAR